MEHPIPLLCQHTICKVGTICFAITTLIGMLCQTTFCNCLSMEHPNGIYITQHLYKSKVQNLHFEFKPLFSRFKALRAKVRQ